MKKLFFFGCIDQVGHYWAKDTGERPPELPEKLYRGGIDGKFTPANNTGQGAGKITKEGSLYIIAWHDYTIDKRGGSNSNIVGYGYHEHPDIAAQEMWDDFKQQYPRMYARQTAPINVLNLNRQLIVTK